MTQLKKVCSYIRENTLNVAYMILIVVIILYLGYRYIAIRRIIFTPTKYENKF